MLLVAWDHLIAIRVGYFVPVSKCHELGPFQEFLSLLPLSSEPKWTGRTSQITSGLSTNQRAWAFPPLTFGPSTMGAWKKKLLSKGQVCALPNPASVKVDSYYLNFSESEEEITSPHPYLGLLVFPAGPWGQWNHEAFPIPIVRI